MTLKKLATRTRKSLSALRGLSLESEPSPPDTPKKQPAPKDESCSPDVEGFGVWRSSPGRDSPSRRTRLMGGLRRMRSSFDFSKSKSSESEDFGAPVEQTPPKKDKMSLALDSETFPPEKPTSNASNSSGIDVHRSSPITVPSSAKQNTAPEQSSFQVGTVPDSPAPLYKKTAGTKFGRRLPSPARFAKLSSMIDPNPTPMPGTNLTLDTPNIIVSSPSSTFGKQDSYFSIRPVAVEGPLQNTHIDGNSGSTVSQHTSFEVNATQPTSPSSEPHTAKSTMVTALGVNGDPPDIESQSRKSLERKKDFVAAYLALEDSTGVESDINESESPDEMQRTDPMGIAARDFIPDPAPLSSESKTSSERKLDFDAAYRALEGTDNVEKEQGTLERRRSTWGRHTGLYDGTGYAASEVAEEETVSHGSASEKIQTASHENQSTSQRTVTDVNILSDLTADQKESLQDIIHFYAILLDCESDYGTRQCTRCRGCSSRGCKGDEEA